MIICGGALYVRDWEMGWEILRWFSSLNSFGFITFVNIVCILFVKKNTIFSVYHAVDCATWNYCILVIWQCIELWVLLRHKDIWLLDVSAYTEYFIIMCFIVCFKFFWGILCLHYRVMTGNEGERDATTDPSRTRTGQFNP